MHWGIEYERKENKEQENVARFCLAHGVKIVIGSHPHVLQPVEWVDYTLTNDTLPKQGLVVYSLGNFVSNQHDRYKDGAMIFTCNLKKNNFTGEITVDSLAYIPTWVYIKHDSARKQYYILPAANFENDTTFITSPEDRTQLNQSLQDTREMMRGYREVGK